MDIAKRTAFVTGGASGLGAAAARTLHAAGATVALVDRDAEHGRALAAELGERVAFLQADVTDGEAMRQAVRHAHEQLGGLHIAVCCAGIGPPKKVLGREGPMPLDFFTQTIQVNLVGTFNTVRLVSEAMAAGEPDGEGERGVIVMTASVAAFEGQVGQAAYSASKGGIVGMTLPIARELAAHGIRVMTIAPGLFDTPLMAGLPEEAKASLGQQVPFPSRLGHPEEYARVVRDIVENRMFNGAVLRLDGALRMAAR